MKILLTGSTGYIGKRLLPILVEAGHFVVCCVRDKDRFTPPQSMQNKIEVIEVDLLDKVSLQSIPKDIDAAYYLVHSMLTSYDYSKLELDSAANFREALNETNVKQVVYLSGITNEEQLSKHLSSRKAVEIELGRGNYHLTTFRAGIIIGSGSASFEIIRDLMEKIPVLIAPKWLNTRCQPIGVSDVLAFLSKTLFVEETYDRNFDIGGSDILTYKEMLLEYARKRKLKRKIYTFPVMSPNLSTYILYFITSTSYILASALVKSMKIEVVCRNDEVNGILNIEPISYEEALDKAFAKIVSNEIVSSWKDAYASSAISGHISDYIQVPTFGCFTDVRQMPFENLDTCI